MKRGSVTSRRKSTLGADRRLISSGVEEFQAARGGGSWAPAGAHTQPGTVRRELSLLTRAGVLEREVQGNQVRFRANERYPIYEELRSILKKTTGVADQLRAALAPLADSIAAAFIYGSIASGQERPNSDVDLMVIGTVRFEDVIRLIHPYQEELRREINPHVLTAAEFKRKARENSSFIARIVKLPKIPVIGDSDELGELGEDRKAKTT
jgi:predicted nucleotidyltransferase